MAIRSFTSQLEDHGGRFVDDDAPATLRQEFIDLAFHVFEKATEYDEARLHKIITQSLGCKVTANPYGGCRYAAGRDIQKVDWPRAYDLICRLWPELPSGLRADYRTGVNRILAGHRIVWDLGEDGQLHRVLPPAAHSQVEAAFRELSQPRFAAALASFREALSAYDDRPQRGRDACKNIFDALESVSKEIFAMPTATFGKVLAEAHKKQSMASETIAALQKLYDMANGHFRHGMITPFTLKPAEVDFVFVSCLAGILLWVRL
ncbi:MAG: hypothetical protein K1X67_16155 [Fimbriimonadaceae bacterium]|nr:hypothetical protein [Fimbriimonadaceae bacterium]